MPQNNIVDPHLSENHPIVAIFDNTKISLCMDQIMSNHVKSCQIMSNHVKSPDLLECSALTASETHFACLHPPFLLFLVHFWGAKDLPAFSVLHSPLCGNATQQPFGMALAMQIRMVIPPNSGRIMLNLFRVILYTVW